MNSSTLTLSCVKTSSKVFRFSGWLETTGVFPPCVKQPQQSPETLLLLKGLNMAIVSQGECSESSDETELKLCKRGVGAAHCDRGPERHRSGTEAAPRIVIEGPSGAEAALRRYRSGAATEAKSSIAKTGVF